MRLIFRTQDVNTTGFDVEKSARARTKGDLVEVLDDGKYAGTNVEPSSPSWEGIHVIVNVPEITKEEARAYNNALKHLIAWEVVASTDEGWRLRVWDNNPGTLTNITREQVEDFITRFNGVVQSFSAGSVVFDIGVYGAATSNGFWLRDVSPITFSEVTHNAAGYKIQAILPSAWTDTPEKRQQVQLRLTSQNCTIFSFDIPSSTVVFDIPRDEAIKEFKEQIRDHLENRIIRRSHFYITPTEIDTIIANGGEVTITKATLLANIKNKLDA